MCAHFVNGLSYERGGGPGDKQTTLSSKQQNQLNAGKKRSKKKGIMKIYICFQRLFS
jgi:hypothetical protein